MPIKYQLKKVLIVGIACAFAVFFAGCQHKGHPGLGVTLPKAPAHYEACFKKLSDIPTGTLTRSKVVALVAELRKSELAKSRCGKDLLAWYSAVQKAYKKK
jgi:hypothetical protein